jgi:hypothetical protein
VPPALPGTISGAPRSTLTGAVARGRSGTGSRSASAAFTGSDPASAKRRPRSSRAGTHVHTIYGLTSKPRGQASLALREVLVMMRNGAAHVPSRAALRRSTGTTVAILLAGFCSAAQPSVAAPAAPVQLAQGAADVLELGKEALGPGEQTPEAAAGVASRTGCRSWCGSAIRSAAWSLGRRCWSAG